MKKYPTKINTFIMTDFKKKITNDFDCTDKQSIRKHFNLKMVIYIIQKDR